MAHQQGGATQPDEYAEPVDIALGPVPGDSASPGPEAPDVPDSASGERRWTRRRIVLGSLLVAGLAGVVVLAAAGIPILREKDASLATPEQAAGLVRDDTAAAVEAAEDLRTALAARVELDATAGAVYNDPADPNRSVLFYGGTNLLFSPEKELEGLFEMLGDQRASVKGAREVPAGDLGGTMKCGSIAAAEGNMAVCGWADHGSVAAALFLGRSVEESAPLMRQLREQVQTRR
jgi:hypothetical protein